MAKKNEKLNAILEVVVDGVVMRHRKIRAVVRFAVCMLLALVFLIGVGLGRML